MHCHSTFGGIESFSCLDDLGDDDILQWPDLSLDVVCDHLVDIADGLPELGMVVVLDGVVCSVERFGNLDPTVSYFIV